MTYKNNFVVVIKSNGRILRETNGEILLPFGKEYSIILKNLNSRRAVVSIDIDGKDVLDSKRIVVNANSTVELKGEKVGGSVRNRFKFIEKTDQISKYRGDRVEDGLIRVEVWFEEPYKPITYYKSSYWTYPYWTYTDTSWDSYTSSKSDINVDTLNSMACCYSISTSSSESSSSSNSLLNCANKDGITVKGSDTKQDFKSTWVNTLELQSTVITLSLKGFKEKRVVKEPVFIKTMFICETCGSKNKSFNKFCGRCGTRLV